MVWVQDHTASGVEAGMAVLVLVYDGTTSSIGRTKMEMREMKETETDGSQRG